MLFLQSPAEGNSADVEAEISHNSPSHSHSSQASDSSRTDEANHVSDTARAPLVASGDKVHPALALALAPLGR